MSTVMQTHPHFQLQVGARFFPYSYADCSLALYARLPDKKCVNDFQINRCHERFAGSIIELRGLIAESAQYYDQFAADEMAWQKAYAIAICKINNLGANYAKKV
jgi:hypothetical protein